MGPKEKESETVMPNCDCGLCKPRPGVDPDPEYGYDRNAVPTTSCLMCGDPIGAEDYYEFPVWARFGQMFLIHERCRPAADKGSK